MTDKQRIETFIEKASLVSARVVRVDSLGSAFEQTIDICRSKQPLDPQMETAKPLDEIKETRVLAAPNLDDQAFAGLESACREADGILLIRKDIRDYPAGIDVGLTLVDFGIAETGTLVLNSQTEDIRLASMLSEIHVAILRVSDLRESALSMVEDLQAMMARDTAYTAFITGPSRTADIERVLTIGVHGPLELVIMLVGE
ncbi:LutC/YkgG family protein [Desulfospira joergensenii]|uniref:LutC/YkgG family protein n=1 Tax=Desulfospira joergensenii TaxID=53329 RepID=UPI0003B6B52C|nr:lactate utilization protein [Desulfospira joergensenii]